MKPRVIAANIINQTLYHQRSLSPLFIDAIPKNTPAQSISFIKELCFGSIRYYWQLNHIINGLLNKPIKTDQSIVQCLLIVGAYQLLHMSKPAYAVVSETVEAARAIGKPWSCGLINKILRRVLEEKDQLLANANQQIESEYNHPQWLIERIKKAWPEQWQHILTENNKRPPMALRVNRYLTTTHDYLNKLKAEKIDAEPIDGLDEGLALHTPHHPSQLPGFKEGLFSVQDTAGQKIIDFLDLMPKQRVLDACAAPGSKACQMLEIEPNIEKLVAIDQDPERLIKVKENITRLQLPHEKIQLVLSNAAHTKQWWDGQAFDRILLDAPCSATGVIRRHPDIKVLRKPNDIQQQVDIQKHLLKHLWPLLKKNGKLIYTTCSILPDENERVIASFVRETANAKSVTKVKDWGMKLTHGIQLLPQENGPDGFYYAILQKTSS